MKVKEVLNRVKYVSNKKGQKTEILIPVELWEALLESWQQMVEQLETKEDIALIQEWLNLKQTGRVETISLDELEQELINDGLV